MTAGAWDRAAVVAEIRDRIWLHLTPASTGSGVLLDAAALLGLPHADVARLADLHYLLHPAVGALLDDAPALLRRLASTTARTTETGLAGVRGPVDWQATARRRVLDRTPTVVTHPTVRDNDVPPNRLLALLLTAMRDRAASLGLREGRAGTAGAAVAERGRRAAALAAHRSLSGVRPAAPGPRDVQAMSSPRFARRNTSLLRAWTAHDALIGRSDADAVRRAVEQRGLAAASDGALFEVLVLFRLRDALASGGWTVDAARLFEGRLRFDAARGNDALTVMFQTTPRAFAATSRYAAAQRAHGEAHPSDLRPDLVLRLRAAGSTPRWLVVECKTSTTGKARSVLVRQALRDLHAYRWAYDDELRAQTAWGLGVIWGTGLAAADHDVAVCTLDRLEQATRLLLA